MNPLRYLALVLLILSSVSLGISAEPRAPAASGVSLLHVTAILKDPGNPKCYIDFKIENPGGSDIVIMESDLPWNSAPALMLFILPTTLGVGKPVQLGPIKDVVAAISKIPAIGCVQGKLALSQHFQNPEKTLMGHSYLLVWSFILTDINTRESKRFSGVIDLDNR